MNIHSTEKDASESEGWTTYTFTKASELAESPPMEWRVNKLFPRHGVAFIYGESGSGKSFLAVDLAIAIARGESWQGYRTKPVGVVYVPLEGAGVPKRLKAIALSRGGERLPDNLIVTKERQFSLNDDDNVKGLGHYAVQAAGVGAVVIIDTLARAAAGIDENSSGQMGTAINAAEEIASMIEGLVILVHHSGKNRESGMRGSSSMKAAAETVIEVSQDSAGRRSWKATKLKDSGDYRPHAFVLEEVQWGEDEYGEPFTSCVVHPDVVAVVPAMAKGMGGNQIPVLAAITKALETAHEGVAYAPAGVRALTAAEARKAGRAALAAMGIEKSKLSTRYADAVKGLLGRGILKTAGAARSCAGMPMKPDKVIWLA